MAERLPPKPAHPVQRGSLQPPCQVMEDQRRLDTWLACLAIKERWDAWEEAEIAAGRMQDTRKP